MSGQKRLLAILLGVLAVVVLVIGGLSAVLLLGGGSKGNTGGSGAAANGFPIGTTAINGRLRLGGSDPLTLDPALATDSTSAEFIVEIFSGLMTINPQLQIVPDLAESYQVSPDGKTYTFKLRDNAVFQDGRPVQASDVKCSLERAASKSLGSTTAPVYLDDIVGATDEMAGRATGMSGIEVVDNKTVKITIDAPKPYFLAKLTYTASMIVDCKQAQSDPQNWTRHPNGTGPYKLVQWQVGQQLVLDANPKYYLGPPQLPQAVYEFSGGSELTRFENNELDLAGVTVSDIDRARDKTNPLNKELHVGTDFTISYIAFNVKTPPFDDVNVRRALGMAIDRNKVTTVTFDNMLQTATGILMPQLPGYTPNDKTLPFDPEGAKKALAASKYAGKMPPITMTEIGGGAEAGLDTQAYVEQWKQILGLDVQVKQADAATFFADEEAGQLQMYNAAWIMDYPDPEDILDLKLYSKSTLNDIGYSNPDVDKLLVQARTEPDPNARLKEYQQAEVLILNDAPWLPLYFSQTYTVVNPAVKGWFDTPMVIPRLRFLNVQR